MQWIWLFSFHLLRFDIVSSDKIYRVCEAFYKKKKESLRWNCSASCNNTVHTCKIRSKLAYEQQPAYRPIHIRSIFLAYMM